MLRRGQLLVNKALDINNDDTNEAITAQGSEEPSTSQALEKLSSPLSNNLTSPDRLEEYSSPILDLLANLSPFKSPDYVSDSSDYGDDIIVAGGKKMRLPNGKSRCTIIEESASEGENTAKSPAFIPCSDDDTVLLISLELLASRSGAAALANCPGGCNCNDETLVVVCEESRLDVLPIALKPFNTTADHPQ
ncbi:hypothetical protein HW555_007142 [Spodoptera exigua]|uniref:Uncharacterized protein n=1 Tax=Spodoptera exigua TaxID=7107 RepID=A0A835L5M3_SPOEX|nr:hypothetical protein HW555_007142 [Spodoptera exigua]